MLVSDAKSYILRLLAFIFIACSYPAAAGSRSGHSAAKISDASNPRYSKVSESDIPVKKTNSLLFIAITSGGAHSPHLRHAIRNTWILPCRLSPVCDYRFFVDTPWELLTDALSLESMMYDDIVFRDSCALMNRHPKQVNYGNSPPVAEHLVRQVDRQTGLEIHPTNCTAAELDDTNSSYCEAVPNYKLRRAYKIDWKVCFMKWALENDRMADYHVFVEDDSFMCVENMLYQTTMLKKHSSSHFSPEHGTSSGGGTTGKKAPLWLPFRTGTAMFDGFDDSSSFMSKEIVEAFALHYGEEGMECANIFGNSSVMDKEASENNNSGSISSLGDRYSENPWLSWGNSWIHWNCNWRQSLADRLDIDILEPNIYCKLVGIESDPQDTYFPCVDRPLIFHHRDAGEILLRNEVTSKIKSDHVCEFMLLIDKVKSSQTMYELWNSAVPHHYHDFSPVFLNDGYDGWKQVMKMFLEEERSCRNWAKRSNIVQNDTSFENDAACLYVHRRRLQSLNKPTESALDQLYEVFCQDGEKEYGRCKDKVRKNESMNRRHLREHDRYILNKTGAGNGSQDSTATGNGNGGLLWWEEAFDTYKGNNAGASTFRLFYGL